jgi:geranylgeranyl diphosphate synthase type I
MSHSKARKQSEIVLTELTRKSKKGLEFAKKTILSEKIQHVKMRDALEYYVSNWNDVTHPGLFAVAYEAVGGNLQVAVPIQAAVAMIAAAFDIHDDIIDKSKLKHAEPTVFGKFGEEIALLLGNAFLIGGFTLFGKSLEGSDQGKAEVFETIKQSLYESGNAHALELCLKKKAGAPPEEYLEIVKMKAASIQGDMRIGAIVGRGTNKEVETLASYGRILGTLAILREEFVDVFDVDELNQRVSNEYMPIPILYAMRDTKSKKKIEKLLARKITSGDVDALIDTVFKTQKVKNLKGYMENLVDQAIRIASNVQNKNLRDQLRNFASSSIEDL